MASYIRLLAFTIVTSLAYPLAASAQNSRDFRSLTIPSSACEINYTEGNGFSGRASGGGFIFAETNQDTKTAVQAVCPVPLSNIRVSGAGSLTLAKFRAYSWVARAAAGAAAGAWSRVLAPQHAQDGEFRPDPFRQGLDVLAGEAPGFR